MAGTGDRADVRRRCAAVAEFRHPRTSFCLATIRGWRAIRIRRTPKGRANGSRFGLRGSSNSHAH
jgi:hypothetical protein